MCDAVPFGKRLPTGDKGLTLFGLGNQMEGNREMAMSGGGAVREATHSGDWYSSDTAILINLFVHYFALLPANPNKPFAIVVP